MVRVISVHHFDSQVIQTCEEPLAATTAPPDRILLALPHHVVEVHDLNLPDECSFCFPTVDRVHELRHCITGNYVVTLEKKQARFSKEVSYTRVYTNWDKKTESQSEQAMRARIAGRVTPSSSQTGADILEMIELPVKFTNINTLACCQETGNVLVGAENIICLFQLVTRTHDISRQKFLDFELWPVTLELSFSPTILNMAEDVVAAMNSTCLHAFRINKGFARPTDWSSVSAQPSPKKSESTKKPSLLKCKKSTRRKRPTSPIRMDMLKKEVCSVGGKRHELDKLANGSLPVLALLPSINPNTLMHGSSWNLHGSPFKPPGAVSMGVAIREIPANEPWAEQMTTMVESLLQLELGEWGDDSMKEELICMALRPLYRVNSYYPPKTESSCPRMRSSAYNTLVAFNCVVCTLQEGYMYHFPVQDGEVLSLGKCIAVYNFTSTVSHIIMEHCLLHAVTSTGLETYTMRSIQAIDEDNEELACPPVDEPVCLVGLRPFIGIVDALLTKSYVVIMSSSSDPHATFDSHEETLYCLRLPSTGTLYSDMMALASTHRFSSPQTYWQLLTEAHCVLRTVTSISTDPDFVPSQVETELYQESCALLTEYYLCAYEDEEDWDIGYKYSCMANLSTTQVMDRLKKLDADAKRARCNLDYSGGLLHFLKMNLINCEDDLKIPVGSLNALLDLLESLERSNKPSFVSSLILESSLLRQFSTDRTIRMISYKIKTRKEKIDALDCLALAVLYTSKGKFNEAGEALNLCGDSLKYNELLNDYWPLLFDNSKKQAKVTPDDWEGVTLSELSVLLINKKPYDLSSVLTDLVTKSKTLNLQQILEVFLLYLPSRMGQEGTKVGSVLQLFLEKVFDHWYQNDSNWKPDPNDSHCKEALKILTRSLLSGLVMKNGTKTDGKLNVGDPKTLFGGKRYKFLDFLPPCSNSDFLPENHIPLLKAQCLLSTNWLDESALSELVQFVGEFVDQDYGFSLMVLAQPQKAVNLLLDKHPATLSQYVQDVLSTEAEFKYVVDIVHSKADEEADHPESGSKTFANLLDVILNHLAGTVNCELFSRIVPPGKEFDSYKLTCQRAEHANVLKDMILASGHRLMATLNLKSFT